MDVKIHVEVSVMHDIYVVNVFNVCGGLEQLSEQTTFTNQAQSVVHQLSHLK